MISCVVSPKSSYSYSFVIMTSLLHSTFARDVFRFCVPYAIHNALHPIRYAISCIGDASKIAAFTSFRDSVHADELEMKLFQEEEAATEKYWGILRVRVLPFIRDLFFRCKLQHLDTNLV